MKLNILFEDKNILAVDKPAGISVHGDGKNDGDETLADFIKTHDKKISKVGEPMLARKEGKVFEIARPGIVHRLDRETSGVLLVAKNQKTFNFLKEQFKNHTIKKVYRALVYGFVSDPKASLATGKKGVIDAPIGRSPRDIRTWTSGRAARNPLREAKTEYKILNKFFDTKKESKDPSHQFSYLELYPKTGRTHQIRVHLRYINHPVVSDPLYRGSHQKALGMKRLALHALSITFKMPDGTEKTIEAPLPADFKKVVKTYSI